MTEMERKMPGLANQGTKWPNPALETREQNPRYLGSLTNAGRRIQEVYTCPATVCQGANSPNKAFIWYQIVIPPSVHPSTPPPSLAELGCLINLMMQIYEKIHDQFT